MLTSINKNAHIFTGIGFACIFGFSFLFTAEAVTRIDPLHFLTFRFLLASLTMMILRKLKLIDIPGEKSCLTRDILLLALLQPILYFSFETMGISLTSSSQAGLMVSIIPIFVVLLSGIFLKEHPKVIQLPFIFFSVLGVIIIVIIQGQVNLTANYLGTFLLLCAAVIAAFYNLLSRKLSVHYSPLALTYYMMNGGALGFTAVSLMRIISAGNSTGFFLPLTDVHVLVALLYLGLFSSVLAFFLMNFTLMRVSAAQASVFANLATVIAVAAGVLLRNEAFSLYHLLGGILIIVGVTGTNYFGQRKTMNKNILDNCPSSVKEQA